MFPWHRHPEGPDSSHGLSLKSPRAVWEDSPQLELSREGDGPVGTGCSLSGGEGTRGLIPVKSTTLGP